METRISDILNSIYANNAISLGIGNVRVRVLKNANDIKYVSVFVLEGVEGSEEVTYSISLPKANPKGPELIKEFLLNHTNLKE